MRESSHAPRSAQPQGEPGRVPGTGWGVGEEGVPVTDLRRPGDAGSSWRPGASAPRERQKVQAAPGREEAPLPRRAALGRPPVPTHGLGQSLTGEETTDSRRLRQRRGSDSRAGSCRCGRRAGSIPAPTTPPPDPPPATLQPRLPPPLPLLPRPRRANANPARGNDGESQSARPVATAAHNLRLPLTAHARGGAGRGRARRRGRDRAQKVWPRFRPAHPRGRSPNRLRLCRWRGRLQVSSPFRFLELGNPSASTSPLFGPSACCSLGSFYP